MSQESSFNDREEKALGNGELLSSHSVYCFSKKLSKGDQTSSKIEVY